MHFERKDLSDDQLIHFYTQILFPRLVEEKMLVLLRQGRISKWFSGIGQEAIAVGATLALHMTNGLCLCIETWVYLQHERCRYLTFLNNGRGIEMATAKAAKEVFTSVAANIIYAE